MTSIRPTSVKSAAPTTSAPSTQPAPAAAPAASTSWAAAAQPPAHDGFTSNVGSASAADSARRTSPTAVATEFYAAFSRADGAAMQGLYAPNATFHDPLFDLTGASAVGGMWSGILKKGSDLHLTSKVLSAQGDTVKVAWTADYKLLGRPIHNESVTTMKVGADGKIQSQVDDWSWSKWARQAFPLGPLVDFPPVKALLRAVIQRA